MTRLTITLTEQEYERLYQSARGELRQPRDQARHLIRKALLNDTTHLNANSDVTTRQGTHVAAAS